MAGPFFCMCVSLKHKTITKNYNPKNIVHFHHLINDDQRVINVLCLSLSFFCRSSVVVIQCYCCQSSDWNLRMHTHTIVLRCTRERCDRLPIKMRWKLIKYYLFYCFLLHCACNRIDATEKNLSMQFIAVA